MCEREAIAEYLVKQNAGTDLKDNDGDAPSDLCKANWPWMQHVGKQIDWWFISLRLLPAEVIFGKFLVDVYVYVLTIKTLYLFQIY